MSPFYSYRAAFRLSLPVLFGYLPLGAAFGVVFSSQLEYAWWIAPLMGLFIYAGAGQLLAVGLLLSMSGLIEVFLAMFLLNSRHLFYGLSLLQAYKGAGWRKPYLIFGLTDETYSLLTTRTRSPDQQKEQLLDFRVTLLNHLYWICGCAIGAALGEAQLFNATGIEFALVSLFILLSLEQYRTLHTRFPLLAGAGAGALSLMLLPASQQLLGALVLICLALLWQYRMTRRRTRKQDTEAGEARP